MTKKADETYDFALSFAGQDRDFARDLAEALAANGFTVFFDENFQAMLWGKDLFKVLLEVYGKKARYIVLIVSEHYVRSPWTTWELLSALETRLRGRDDAVLPVRLDDTEVPSLPKGIGWIDVRRHEDRAIETLVGLLTAKKTSIAPAPAPVKRRRVLLLGSGGLLAALGTYFGASLFRRAEPGDERWRRGFESACFPVVNGDDVVLSLRDGSVVGLRQSDGVQSWRVDAGGVMTGPCTVIRGLVLASAATTQTEGRLTAIDTGGAVRWTLVTEGMPWRQSEAADNKILVGTSAGWVLSVDGRTGEVVERVRVSTQVNDVVELQGFVYSATDVDGLQVHLRGKQAWSRTTAGNVVGLATAANRIFLTVSNSRQRTGQVQALDAATGEIEWQHSIDAQMSTGPTLVRGQVLVPDILGVMHSLDATSGAVRWQQDVGAVSINRVTWDGDTLYVGTRRGLAVLDARSGAVKWTKNVTSAWPSDAYGGAQPVLGEKTVFLGYGDMQVSSKNGDVYAFVR
ncbi:outer membrane protein assembly factor BamB family protein [Lentzea sp. HUAS TT2]|uniref:outer membrane protein assembly factor BamB family protein n=1 Tax=Lentzea sp. HUAS TT2 TaxID=3447454 RepID=UPI003F6E507A